MYPKNLYLDRKPFDHAAYHKQVIGPQVELMYQRGIWVRPDRGEK